MDSFARLCLTAAGLLEEVSRTAMFFLHSACCFNFSAGYLRDDHREQNSNDQQVVMAKILIDSGMPICIRLIFQNSISYQLNTFGLIIVITYANDIRY